MTRSVGRQGNRGVTPGPAALGTAVRGTSRSQGRGPCRGAQPCSAGRVLELREWLRAGGGRQQKTSQSEGVHMSPLGGRPGSSEVALGASGLRWGGGGQEAPSEHNRLRPKTASFLPDPLVPVRSGLKHVQLSSASY